jgi:hypothetical protein
MPDLPRKFLHDSFGIPNRPALPVTRVGGALEVDLMGHGHGTGRRARTASFNIVVEKCRDSRKIGGKKHGRL